MKDPICKNLIEEELASIKEKVVDYTDMIEHLKQSRNWPEEGGFLSKYQHIEDEIEILQDRMNWLLENSRARLSTGTKAVFNEAGPGLEIEGEVLNLDKNAFKKTFESTIGKTEVKVGDKYTGATENDDDEHRIVGFSHDGVYIFMERRKLLKDGIPWQKELIVSKANTFFNNFWKR